MGSTAFFEVSYGFVLRKGTLEMLRAMEVENLGFSLRVRSYLLESRKL